MKSATGSVRRLDSGRWQARFTVRGERKPIGTFATKRAADAALRKVLVSIDEGTYFDRANGNILFSEYAPQALEGKQLAPRTRQNYASLLKHHLLPTFGRLTLNQITEETVDSWWMSLDTGPVNARNAYYALRSIMKRAEKHRRIQRTPCNVDGAGGDPSKPRPHMTPAQFVAIRDASTMPVIFDVLFAAHLRISELTALTRGDVDLETEQITVSKQLQQVTGQGRVIRETKTGKERTVTMLQNGTDALRSHLQANPALPSAPLFRGATGAPIHAVIIRKEWKRAAESLGLGQFRLHDIRHTSLTFTARDASLRENMHRAGHSTTEAAIRYQHASADRDREIARAASLRLLG